VAVGLVTAFGVEESDPSRELRRHIHDVFAGSHELLRQQRTDPGRALHRPTARFEASREHQQPVPLLTIGPDLDLVDDLLRRIEHRGHVRPLVGIDPDDEHLAPPASRTRHPGGQT
jgi:hypothetical protein